MPTCGCSDWPRATADATSTCTSIPPPSRWPKAAEHARSLGARLLHTEDGLIIAASPAGFTFCLVSWHGEHVVPSPLPREAGASRVDTLCIDVPPTEFERECAFWSALTGWETRPAPVPGFAFLRMPPQLPIRLILQRLEDAAPGQRARAHVDFGCPDPAMVTQHVTLGAQGESQAGALDRPGRPRRPRVLPRPPPPDRLTAESCRGEAAWRDGGVGCELRGGRRRR